MEVGDGEGLLAFRPKAPSIGPPGLGKFHPSIQSVRLRGRACWADEAASASSALPHWTGDEAFPKRPSHVPCWPPVRMFS